MLLWIYLGRKKELSLSLTPSFFTSQGDWIRNQRPRPQTRTLTGLSYTPNCGCKVRLYFEIANTSVIFIAFILPLF